MRPPPAFLRRAWLHHVSNGDSFGLVYLCIWSVLFLRGWKPWGKIQFPTKSGDFSVVRPDILFSDQRDEVSKRKRKRGKRKEENMLTFWTTAAVLFRRTRELWIIRGKSKEG